MGQYTYLVGIGLCKNADSAMAFYELAGNATDDLRALVGISGFERMPRSVKLVVVSMADLGFTHITTRERIYQIAASKGWYLCSVEMALAFNQQYLGNLPFDQIVVGMKAFAGPKGEQIPQRILSIVGKENALVIACGHPKHKWALDTRWAFVLPYHSSNS